VIPKTLEVEVDWHRWFLRVDGQRESISTNLLLTDADAEGSRVRFAIMEQHGKNALLSLPKEHRLW
jgi:hypothetical protein